MSVTALKLTIELMPKTLCFGEFQRALRARDGVTSYAVPAAIMSRPKFG